MNYFLGIDAGGTKTKAVVIDEDSKLLSEANGGSANYHNIGLEKTSQTVISTLKQAVKQANLSPDQISRCVIGIAGCDTQKDYQQLFKAFTSEQMVNFAAKLTLVNDTKIALYSGTLPPGIVVICGTGCNVYGINSHGDETFAGNWGYLFGDKGSGYNLGKRMVEKVFEVLDGRLENSLLVDKLKTKLDFNSPEDLVDWRVEKKPSVKNISDFAPLAISAAEEGDEIAKDLVDETVSELGRAVLAVVKKLKVENEYNRLVTVGGLFESKYFRGVFAGYVTALLKRVRIVKPLVSIAVGAALMGRHEFGKVFSA